MSLLLVRHAQAVQGGDTLPDEARWLTQDGRTTARKVGGALREAGVVVDRIFASPLVRAVQTAELFAEQLGFEAEIEILPSLAYSVPAATAVRELKRLERGLIAAFGHMPTIADIAGSLTLPSHARSFTPSEALYISEGRAQWVLSPDSLAVRKL